MPSLNLHVYVTSNPNVLKTSAIVQNWVADVETRLPPGVQIDLWRDSAVPFPGRVQTLLGNGLGGLALVYLLLLVFLRPLLAMWVCVGIMVAFLGCFWILPYTGVSLNMISLFAFLLILGIIVDDAIIVGESIHTHQELGEPGSKGAINGTHGVVKPVLFAVISTMIFFVPLMFLPGELSQVAASIPIVVILALFFSLIECLWILPSHLANMRPLKPAGHPLLANDPHLGISVPPIWHFAHLESPGQRVAGAFIPGSPLLIVGRNPHAAWGVTNVMTDCADLVAFRTDSKNS